MIFPLGKHSKRKRIVGRPFPREWTELLEQFSFYKTLPDRQRQELHGLIHIFLAEKNFVGCAGLEVTDEMRVFVAAQACVLLLNRETEIYPRVNTILMYPSTYFRKDRENFQDEPISDAPKALAGEAWHQGIVVLAWDEVLSGALDPGDGRNLVLHEFAHQLDFEDGFADGVPLLQRKKMYLPWVRVIEREHHVLQRKAQQNSISFLDKYGAKNRAEFFAVATETFFERPAAFHKRHPELYAHLCEYYRRYPAGVVSVKLQDSETPSRLELLDHAASKELLQTAVLVLILAIIGLIIFDAYGSEAVRKFFLLFILITGALLLMLMLLLKLMDRLAIRRTKSDAARLSEDARKP